MNYWIVNCTLAFLLCVFFAGIVIPQILLISFRKHLFDVPDERKIHHSTVPRLGGLAFNPVIFLTFALLLGANLVLGHSEMLREAGKDSRCLTFVYCALSVLYLVGMADDLIGVRYRAKFFVQILCGIMLVAGGVHFDNLHGILGIHGIPTWLGYPLTVLAVVFIVNAINLIDGIDGLASGLSSIACLFYGFIFFKFHHYIYAMVAFATLGVLVPFFYYNVFGNAEKEKKIFMGDTGSLTIGMILCFLSTKLAMYGSYDDIGSINPLVLAFSPLFVPCADVVRVNFHRIRNGKDPFLPDNNHIHHKLLAIGMNQHKALISIVFVSVAFVVFNFILSYYRLNVNLILLLDVLIWTLSNIWLTKRIAKLQKGKANE